MTLGDVLPLTLYGLVVVLTALGAIGQPLLLVPAAGLGVLWAIMLVGHVRARR
jgi:hypothetical protein